MATPVTPPPPRALYPPNEKHEILETHEQHPAERAQDETSPGTACEQDLDDSDVESTPPVPPTPRQFIQHRSSRSRVKRSPRDYASDPATDPELPRLSSMRSNNRPRFHDNDWYESENDRTWREEVRHPDYYQERRGGNRVAHSAKPPRSHFNTGRPQSYQQDPSKLWIEETRSYRDPFSPMVPTHNHQRMPDEEQGYGGWPDHRNTYSSETPRIQWSSLTKEQKSEVIRLPWLQWMNSDVKNHFVASLGEFVGTTMFLVFAFAGTEVANIQSNANGSSSSDNANTTTGASTGFDVSVLLYISLAFGFSLMVNVWIFFRISGGLFNPAVTLAMSLIRAITPIRAICLFVAQVLGGILASVIVRFLFPENFNVRTTLGGGANLAQGVFIEALLTAELVFTIFMLAAEKHRATFIAPVGIGLALFIAEMVGIQFTGGSLNPARSFGPCVVTATFDSEHWIYWVGPLIGSLIAVMFYRFIKVLEYEMVNPGADADPLNDPTKNPQKRAELKFTARHKTSFSSNPS